MKKVLEFAVTLSLAMAAVVPTTVFANTDVGSPEAAMQDVDKSALVTAMSTVADIEESDYTTASWNAMQSEYNSAVIMLHNASATQAQVDGVINRLQGAIKALVKVNIPAVHVDKTALEAAISAVSDFVEADYTPASWSAMQSVYQSAIIMLHNGDATQAEVNGMISKLNGAIKALIKVDATTPSAVVDRTQLLKSIQAVSVVTSSPAIQMLYTPASWNTMMSYYNAAIAIRDNTSATQAQVDGAAMQLNGAVIGLVNVGTQTIEVDKTALSTALSNASALKKADYTSTSWNTMFSYYESAIILLHNGDATQAQVDGMVQKLNGAVMGLVKSDAMGKEVDKTALSSTIQAANALNEATFTAESWHTMRNVYDSAIIALHNEKASQADIDNAASALQKAVDALILTSIEGENGVMVNGVFANGTTLAVQSLDVNELANKITDKTFLSKVTLENAFAISLQKDGIAVLPSGEVQVSMTLAPSLLHKQLGIIYVDAMGNVQVLPSAVQDNKITFTTTHFSTYAIISYKEEPLALSNPKSAVTPSSTAKTANSVITGDETSATIYVVAMLVATAGVIFAVYKRNMHVR